MPTLGKRGMHRLASVHLHSCSHHFSRESVTIVTADKTVATRFGLLLRAATDAASAFCTCRPFACAYRSCSVSASSTQVLRQRLLHVGASRVQAGCLASGGASTST